MSSGALRKGHFLSPPQPTLLPVPSPPKSPLRPGPYGRGSGLLWVTGHWPSWGSCRDPASPGATAPEATLLARALGRPGVQTGEGDREGPSELKLGGDRAAPQRPGPSQGGDQESPRVRVGRGGEGPKLWWATVGGPGRAGVEVDPGAQTRRGKRVVAGPRRPGAGAAAESRAGRRAGRGGGAGTTLRAQASGSPRPFPGGGVDLGPQPGGGGGRG